MIKLHNMADLDIAFGNITGMPEYADLPEEYRRGSGGWNAIVNRAFFEGINFEPLRAKPGVDRRKALRVFQAWMHSFEPQHERKVGACALLLSENFEPIDPALVRPVGMPANSNPDPVVKP